MVPSLLSLHHSNAWGLGQEICHFVGVLTVQGLARSSWHCQSVMHAVTPHLDATTRKNSIRRREFLGLVPNKLPPPALVEMVQVVQSIAFHVGIVSQNVT